MCRRAGRIHERSVPLQLLEHLLVVLVCRHAGHAEGHDLNTPQVTPLLAQHLVQRVRQLQRVARQLGVPDAVLADPGKRRLQRRQQLRLQLAVQPVTGVRLADVAAHVGVEQHGVADVVAVLAEAADAHVDVDARALIHHAEGHGRRRAVLVPDQLLGVEVVDPLVLGRLTAEGEAVDHVVEHILDAVTQIAGENGRLRGHIVCILAGHRAHIHDLSLIHDQHTLAVRHRDDAAVADHVVVALCVAGALARLLLALDCQHVFRNRVAVKEFLPLICHHAARGAHCCFDKSHILLLFCVCDLSAGLIGPCYSSIHCPSARSQ